MFICRLFMYFPQIQLGWRKLIFGQHRLCKSDDRLIHTESSQARGAEGRTVRPLARRALQKTSFEMTSSFFWSSPWMLAAPARPVRLLMPARFTRLAICTVHETLDSR